MQRSTQSFDKPGILSTLNIETRSQNEKKIIEAVSQIWFVTFFKSANFKNSEYHFFFAKPTREISEQFHFSREVLVLITPSSHFMPRCLDFVDKLMGDYQNRLDKLCVFIVSKDDQVSEKVQGIILQDKESRIIVPFTYDELINNPDSSELQVNRLKKSFYERDLFSYETPLKTDTYFFGRHEAIQSLYGKYQTGQCSSLFGLRRIGKTSVIYAILRMMDVRNEPNVYLDCSETSFHMRRWNECLFFIVNDISKKYSLPKHLKLSSEDDYTEKNASICFERDIESIYNHFKGKRLLIALDEIENITFTLSPTIHWKESLDFIYFWQALRSLFQKRQDLFSVMISGVNPISIETPIVNTYDNPIYRFISPSYLPFFDANEVKEMVSTIGNYMGMSFDDEIYTYLTDDFGGHPFIIRQVCSHLFKEKKGLKSISITKYEYERKREEINNSIVDYLDLIITVLRERYPDEYQLIEYLAAGDQKTFTEFFGMSEKLVEHLIGYGLVKRDAENFHFTIKTIASYINTQSRIRLMPTTREEKWHRLCEGRNKLETDLRQLISHSLKYKHSPEKAKEIFLAIISPPDRQKSLSLLKFSEIFKSKLYFEDLRKVIEKNWSDFEKVFNNEKSKFSQYMTIINSTRGDAHANDVSDDDMGLFEITIDWLQKKVDKYLE
ncbi:ATP-binding protein [Escherichia coli]|uniref:AAA-like domain-containing protein n=3 Tax=Escherichia coli TaxID=562 RepID=UPI000390BA8E|nr:AAA-like domain-containing protein [Escherichia coli]HBV28193.1 ATP-binding protein [Shigella sp.]AUO40412.1 ATP-binding protein [Escherichia coli]AXE70004.1 ATP-binding protein [Escherichia coli]EEW0020473.1 ATP-binding protein [Escherichia coli]EFC9594488.1 ATP-binding protein [Escherichia coli]